MLRPSAKLQNFFQAHPGVLRDLYAAYHLDGLTAPSTTPQHIVECRDDDGRTTWLTTNLSTRQQYTDKEWWKLDWMNRETKPTRVITGWRSWANHLFAADKPTIGYPSQASSLSTRLLHLDLDGIRGQERSVEFIDRLRNAGAYVAPGLKGYQAIFIFAERQPSCVLRWIATEIGKQAALNGWHLDKTNVGSFNGEVVEEVATTALPILGPLHRRRYIIQEDTWTLDHDLTDEFIAHYSGPYHVELSALTSTFRPRLTLRDFLIGKDDTQRTSPRPNEESAEGLYAPAEAANESEALDIAEVRQVLASVLARLKGTTITPLPQFIAHGEFHLHFRDFARMTPEYIASASPAEKVEERVAQVLNTHYQQDLLSIGKRKLGRARNAARRAENHLFDDVTLKAMIGIAEDLHRPTTRVSGATLKSRRLASVVVMFLAAFAYRKSTPTQPWVLTIKQAALLAEWRIADYGSWKSGIAAFHKLIFKPTMEALTERAKDTQQSGSLWAFDATYSHQRWGMAAYLANALLRYVTGLLRPRRQQPTHRPLTLGVFVDADGNDNGRNAGMTFRPFVSRLLRC